MRKLEKAGRTGLLVICLGASACLDVDCAPGYSGREARDDRGPQLAGDVYEFSGALAFSADGAEVFYTAAPGSGWAAVLRAVRLADGMQRDVDGGARVQGPLFPTAAALYEIEYVPPPGDGAGEHRLREAFSGVNPLLESPPDLSQLLALSPSGRRLLGVTGGTWPIVLDLDSLERTSTTCSWPATFSPASDAVLCGGGMGRVIAAPLAGQEAPALVAIPDTSEALAVSWTGQRMLAVFDGSMIDDPVLVADPASGEVVARLSAGEHTSVGGPMEFSRDGAALAFVERECLETHGYYGCSTRGELRVRILDLATGRASTVASAGWRTPEDGNFISVRLALSPDSRTIAYSFGDELHVRPTGR